MKPKNRTTLSTAQALKAVRFASKTSSLVNRTDHALKRMIERKISLQEILTVLGNGRIREDPGFNMSKNSWECTVQGTVPSTGKPINIVTAIKIGEPGVLVVTIYDIRDTKLRWK